MAVVVVVVVAVAVVSIDIKMYYIFCTNLELVFFLSKMIAICSCPKAKELPIRKVKKNCSKDF